jgi:hypothetical protein
MDTGAAALKGSPETGVALIVTAPDAPGCVYTAAEAVLTSAGNATTSLVSVLDALNEPGPEMVKSAKYVLFGDTYGLPAWSASDTSTIAELAALLANPVGVAITMSAEAEAVAAVTIAVALL